MTESLPADRIPASLERCLAQVAQDGYSVVEGVLSPDFLFETRRAMYRVQTMVEAEVGKARLCAAGEAGVVRLMIKFDPFFYRFLEVPELLAVVDATVSATAILHLQNGFILPPTSAEQKQIFQRQYHQDFPRLLNGYLASINVMFAISDFTANNGATLVLPGTQQTLEPPSEDRIGALATPAICRAGSMLVFDSTLWHCAGVNETGSDRLAINHQFVRSYMKQQIDYVRAVGEEMIVALPLRSRRLLGYHVRVPTSLDEYYRPVEERLYRRRQG